MSTHDLLRISSRRASDGQWPDFKEARALRIRCSSTMLTVLARPQAKTRRIGTGPSSEDIASRLSLLTTVSCAATAASRSLPSFWSSSPGTRRPSRPSQRRVFYVHQRPRANSREAKPEGQDGGIYSAVALLDCISSWRWVFRHMKLSLACSYLMLPFRHHAIVRASTRPALPASVFRPCDRQ